MTLRLHWGTGIAAVYTIFACGTIGFVTFAMRQHVDLVSDDYYARAIDHDERARAAARVAALGDAFRILVADDGRSLRVTWPAAAISPDVNGRLTCYRPSNATADRSTPVEPDATGQQRVAFDDLAPGRWRLQAEWQAGGRTYYAERDFVVR